MSGGFGVVEQESEHVSCWQSNLLFFTTTILLLFLVLVVTANSLCIVCFPLTFMVNTSFSRRLKTGGDRRDCFVFSSGLHHCVAVCVCVCVCWCVDVWPSYLELGLASGPRCLHRIRVNLTLQPSVYQSQQILIHIQLPTLRSSAAINNVNIPSSAHALARMRDGPFPAWRHAHWLLEDHVINQAHANHVKHHANSYSPDLVNRLNCSWYTTACAAHTFMGCLLV